MRRPAALLAAAMLPAAAAAQTAEPWPTLKVAAPLAGPLSLAGELVYRAAPDSDRADQFRTRAWLDLRALRHLQLAIGYGHLVKYQPNGRNDVEDQIAEQAEWMAIALPRLRLLLRTRLEERFFRGDDGTGVRLREQVRVELPVVRAGPALVLWSEPFVTLARTRLANERVDRVRSFAGVLVPAGRRMSLELGYLRQYQPSPAGAVWIDAVPVTLGYRF